MKLEEINSFCWNIVVDNSWVDVSEQRDSILWNLVTHSDSSESNVKNEADSDGEIKGNMYAKKNELFVTNAQPTVMYNLDGLNIDLSQRVVNIAPAEDQISVSHTNQPDCEALAFPK